MTYAFNMDCMEAMREMPDKAFDLAVVDPPYGDGCSQVVQVERERERLGGRGTDLAGGLTDTSVKISRANWHGKKKYHLGDSGKKALRGTQPREKNILESFSVFHANKLYGAAIILIFPQRGAFLCGESLQSLKRFLWRWRNTHGQVLLETQKFLNIHRKGKRATDFIRLKSR